MVWSLARACICCPSCYSLMANVTLTKLEIGSVIKSTQESLGGISNMRTVRLKLDNIKLGEGCRGLGSLVGRAFIYSPFTEKGNKCWIKNRESFRSLWCLQCGESRFLLSKCHTCTFTLSSPQVHDLKIWVQRQDWTLQVTEILFVKISKTELL